MELIQILVVIGIIFALAIRQISKYKSETDTGGTTYNPETGMEGHQLPEAWQQLETFGKDVLHKPTQAPSPTAQTRNGRKKISSQSHSGIVTTSESADVTDSSSSEQDFTINSPEELRRAIVWSEIINRKY